MNQRIVKLDRPMTRLVMIRPPGRALTPGPARVYVSRIISLKREVPLKIATFSRQQRAEQWRISD